MVLLGTGSRLQGQVRQLLGKICTNLLMNTHAFLEQLVDTAITWDEENEIDCIRERSETYHTRI
jgi:hypothetical protein